MKCVNCGFEMDDNAKFCSQCGTPVVKPILPIEPEEEPAGGYEADADEELSYDAVDDQPGEVYASLGNDDDDEDYDDFAYQERRAQRQAKKARKSRRNAAVFAIVGILLVAALVAVIAKSFGDAKTGSSKEEQASSASQSKESETAIAASAVSGSVVPSETEGKLSTEELTAAVSSIDEKYKAIDSSRTAGEYQASAYKDGVTAYWKDDAISLIMAENGSEGSQYDRAYYYDENGTLFYADLEGTDAYKLYYKDGELIRLSYAKDSSKADDVTNYDQTGTQEYLDWESSALDYSTTLMNEAKAAGIVKSKEEQAAEAEAQEEAKKSTTEETEKEDTKEEDTKKETETKTEETTTKTKEQQSTATSSKTSGGYIFGDSDSEYIAESDLKDMSKSEVRLALNEIYARNGATFDSDTYKKYFESKSWYKGTVSKSEAEKNFNKYEKANVKMIVNYEKSKGWR